MGKERKDQDPGVESLSDRLHNIRSFVQNRIEILRCVSETTHVRIQRQLGTWMPFLTDKYVIVPVDKALNNIVFVCEAHYLNCLIKDDCLIKDNCLIIWLDIDSNTSCNSTYKLTTFNNNKILNNHKSWVSSLNIEIKCEDLPYFYWIPKLHKNPHKRYIARSLSCYTKDISNHLTRILSAVKDGQQSTTISPTLEKTLIICGFLKNSKHKIPQFFGN